MNLSSRKYTILLSILLVYLSLIYVYQIHRGAENILFTDYGKFYRATQFYQMDKSPYANIFLAATARSTAQSAPVKQLGVTLDAPFFVLLTLPLGYLSYAVSFWAWSVISIFCGVLSILLLRRALFPVFEKNLIFLLSVFLFAYLPTFVNVGFGQVGLVFLPLLVGAWCAARSRYFILAGILLGLLASLKIIFGLFLIYFVLRREWRALLGFVLTAIFCAVLSAAVFGAKVYLNYYQVLQQITWYSSSWNAAIYGVLVRLLGGNELNIPVFALPYLTRPVYILLSLFLLGGLIVFLKHDKKIGFAEQKEIGFKEKLDLDFSCVIVTMLLVSPLSWLYYFSWLLIPCCVVAQMVRHYANAFKLQVVLAAGIFLSGIPHLLATPENIIGNNAFPVFFLASLYSIVLFIMLGLLYYLRFTRLLYQDTVMQSNLDYTSLFVYSLAILQSLFGIEYLINSHVIFGVR